MRALRDHAVLSFALPAAALATALLALGAQGAAASTTLRWQQPAGSAAVTEFRIYAGATLGAGLRVQTGLPTPDAQGVYSATVTIDRIEQGIATYVWVSAANAAGESPISTTNNRFYPAVAPPDDGGPIPGAVDTGGRTGDGLLVPLRATGASPSALGHAELRQNADSEFVVAIEGVPNGLYALFVDGVKRGDITVSAGHGVLSFSSAPGAGELLLDFAVKGLVVEVRSGGQAVLGRLFPTDVTSALGRYAPETRAFQFRVGLANSRVDLDATGDAEWRSTNGAELLRVGARDLPAGTYRLFVNGTSRATAVADTRGSLRIDLGATTRPPQPLGYPLRGAQLEIRNDAGVTLLEGVLE
jgi:hypothetical protein